MLANHVRIRTIAGREDCLQSEVIKMSKWIVFVIVTARAAQRESEKSRPGCVHRVSKPLVFELGGHHGRVLRHRADGVKAGGKNRVRVARPKLIPSDLLLNK